MPQAPSTLLSCHGRFLRDEQDRVRIFRGANVSGRSKLPPFVPLRDPAQLDPLAGWGFNVIRLLLTWEGLEPRRGELDEGYLETMANIAEEAGKRGLHVIVDLHQDIFGRAFGGDGCPAWVVDKEAMNVPDRRWFLRYFLSRDVRRAQREFWTDRHGHRSAFLSSLRKVLQRMSEVPAVIGYDPWNEPMSGLRHLVTGRFERGLLLDFYRECMFIRDDVDPQRLLFIEPWPVSALGAPTFLGPIEGSRLAYAPHIYDTTAILLRRYTPRGSTFFRTLDHHLQVAERMGTPLLIGEFGVLNWIKGGTTMMEHQCRAFDRHFVSWTVWHYNPSDQDWNDEGASIVHPDGRLQAWTPPLIRPFPQAIAGTPLRCESKRGQPWTFEYRPRGSGITEVVVPERWHEGSLNVSVRGADYELKGDRLEVSPSTSSTVSITLERS